MLARWPRNSCWPLAVCRLCTPSASPRGGSLEAARMTEHRGVRALSAACSQQGRRPAPAPGTGARVSVLRTDTPQPQRLGTAQCLQQGCPHPAPHHPPKHRPGPAARHWQETRLSDRTLRNASQGAAKALSRTPPRPGRCPHTLGGGGGLWQGGRGAIPQLLPAARAAGQKGPETQGGCERAPSLRLTQHKDPAHPAAPRRHR